MNLILLFLPMSLFSTLYAQVMSRWTLQADKMNGDIGFYIIKPDQMQAINPFVLLTFIPLFDVIVYPILSKIGIRRSLQKITIGGIFSAISFLIAALVESWIGSSPEHTVNILWQLPQHLIMGIAEIMFSVTCLTFSYEMAPLSMKSISQAFRFLSIVFGNFVLIVITKVNILQSQMHEFIFFGVVMLINMLIFGFMARNFERKSVLMTNTNVNQPK